MDHYNYHIPHLHFSFSMHSHYCAPVRFSMECFPFFVLLPLYSFLISRARQSVNLIHRYGKNTISYFRLSEEKSYFFSNFRQFSD